MSAENVIELFTEISSPAQLRPTSWTCEEEACGGFRLTVTAKAPVAFGDSLSSQLFGQPATFVVYGTPPLVRRGVITSVVVGGGDDSVHTDLRITAVPRLELMGLKRTSRIFQAMSTVDVLKSLADEWRIAYELRLTRQYSKRKYVTQYRETDLDFLRRVASREGIGFYLEHAELADGEKTKPGDERLVFYDSAQAYPPVAAGPDPALKNRLVYDRQAFGLREHQVKSFRLERRIAPELVRLGDFDFRKPRLQLRASAAVSSTQRSPINASLGGEQLSVYLHADRAELDLDGGRAEISDELAKVRLEQAQRDAVVGRGTSRCARLTPGHVIQLEEHADAPSLNQAYVVTSVSHRGHVPEIAGTDSGEPVYENTFTCIPAHVVFRTPLPALDLRQVTETATVVGPEGGELHTDEQGRVQVKFHWDEGGEVGAHCWLRVLTTWAGAGWGSQFLPRVGMEVLVGFLSGDVDQPIVLGSVYNGTHPTPFAVPEHAAKAGFLSQSLPGGDGGSELTFDDKKGEERFTIRAERDMTHVVYNDLDRHVGRDERVLVEGSSETVVNKSATVRVLGARTESTAADLTEIVGGSAATAIAGNLDLRVTGNRMERIEGQDRTEHVAALTQLRKADTTERVLGHKVVIVGEHDARRSLTHHIEGTSYAFSTGTHEIASDTEIVLRVGKSFLRLGPESLDLVVDEIRTVGKAVTLQTEEALSLYSDKKLELLAETADVHAQKRFTAVGDGARVKLAKEARVDASIVKLNCDPSPPDPLEPPAFEPPEPTTIELADSAGAPLKNRRFVLTTSDGSERTGVLDGDGKAKLYLKDGETWEISFPDIDQPHRG